MFVRWRKRVSSIEANGTVYYAYLIESKRTSGKPRQKSIAYLGSIGENLHECWSMWFWCDVEDKLARLLIGDDKKERVRAELAKRVARPTSNEALQQAYRTRPSVAAKRARGWPLHNVVS